jgi:hypothetical protein
MRKHMLQVIMAVAAVCTLSSGLKAETARANQPMAPHVLKLNESNLAKIRPAGDGVLASTSWWWGNPLGRRFRLPPIENRFRLESRARRA